MVSQFHDVSSLVQRGGNVSDCRSEGRHYPFGRGASQPPAGNRRRLGPIDRTERGLFAFTIVVAATLFVPAQSLLALDAGQRPPNMVFILIDDLGWTDLSCFGSGYYETPEIDRLARQGVRFTNAYSNGPNCAPSRASLMTGMYTPRHGIFTVGSAARGKSRYRKLIPTQNKTVLSTDFATLPKILSENGYVCGHIGKWHLGEPGAAGPLEHGFSFNLGGNHSGLPRGGYFSPYRNPQLPDGAKGEYLTDRLTGEAEKFIRDHRERPFFLYLSHYTVHTPIQPRPDLLARYQRKPRAGKHTNAAYAAMVAAADESVGRIVALLDELNLSRETLIIFFSDNGGHGRFTSNAPLRGSKGMLYEGGIRVPLIVRWPGVAPAGRECDMPVIGSDFFPTLLGAAGIARPVRQPVDGQDLGPWIRRPNAVHADRALFWHFPAYLEAYLPEQGRWRTTPACAIRRGRWKLHEFFEDRRVELYDLQADVGEKTDLSMKLPKKVGALRGELHRWRARVGAPVPTKKNPRYDPSADAAF